MADSYFKLASQPATCVSLYCNPYFPFNAKFYYDVYSDANQSLFSRRNFKNINEDVVATNSQGDTNQEVLSGSCLLSLVYYGQESLLIVLDVYKFNYNTHPPPIQFNGRPSLYWPEIKFASKAL